MKEKLAKKMTGDVLQLICRSHSKNKANLSDKKRRSLKHNIRRICIKPFNCTAADKEKPEESVEYPIRFNGVLRIAPELS